VNDRVSVSCGDCRSPPLAPPLIHHFIPEQVIHLRFGFPPRRAGRSWRFGFPEDDPIFPCSSVRLSSRPVGFPTRKIGSRRLGDHGAGCQNRYRASVSWLFLEQSARAPPPRVRSFHYGDFREKLRVVGGQRAAVPGGLDNTRASTSTPSAAPMAGGRKLHIQFRLASSLHDPRALLGRCGGSRERSGTAAAVDETPRAIAAFRARPRCPSSTSAPYNR
jgi:hypothetical protein